MNMKWI